MTSISSPFVCLSQFACTRLRQSLGLCFPGRDYGTYIGYFVGFFEPDTPYKALMTIRTFLSSFLIAIGASNIFFLNIVLFFSFLGSLLLCYLIGLQISLGHARTFLLVMSLNVPLMIFFHEFSSDLILAIFLVPYVMATYLVARSDKPRKYFILGLFTFCLVVIRPSNQLFLIMGFFAILKIWIEF